LTIFGFSISFGANLDTKYWSKNLTFKEYLKKNSIKNIKIDDKKRKYISKIIFDKRYYELRDDSGKLTQSLIPISSTKQIHIAKRHYRDEYIFEIINIDYIEERHYNKISSNNLDTNLTKAISKIVKHKNSISKAVRIDVLYRQKLRMGKRVDLPKIEIAKFDFGKTQKFIYSNKVKGYTKTIRQRKLSRFGMPLRHIRITSTYSTHRWHPILHRYRPHHGTDFGARSGTPLLAVNSGVVIFSGRMGGYGNVVKIRHIGGYISLYAHQSRRRAKRGQRVRKGQIIGYVGSTGRSTGPHLHFGLMRYGRWIDPMRVLRKKSIITYVTKKITKNRYNKSQKEIKAKLVEYINDNTKPFIYNNTKLQNLKVGYGK